MIVEVDRFIERKKVVLFKVVSDLVKEIIVFQINEKKKKTYLLFAEGLNKALQTD